MIVNEALAGAPLLLLANKQDLQVSFHINHPLSSVYLIHSSPSLATFMEIDHEIIPRVILPLLLIQERHLSVSSETMCKSTAYRTKPAEEKSE